MKYNHLSKLSFYCVVCLIWSMHFYFKVLMTWLHNYLYFRSTLTKIAYGEIWRGRKFFFCFFLFFFKWFYTLCRNFLIFSPQTRFFSGFLTQNVIFGNFFRSPLTKIAYGEIWRGQNFFFFFYMVLHLVLIYSGLFQKKAILGARTKMEFCIVSK